MKLSAAPIITIAAVIVVLVVGAFFLLRHLLGLPMYVDRQIGTDVNVASNWVEIASSPSLTKIRRFQSVILRIDGAYTDTELEGPDVFLADGTPISPELEISDEDGNWHVLRSSTFGLGESIDGEKRKVSYVGFKSREIDHISSFKSIRIKSSTPFRCKSVEWRNYNLK